MKLLKSLSKDVFFDPRSRTSAVQDALNEYYEKSTNKLSRNLVILNWSEKLEENQTKFVLFFWGNNEDFITNKSLL